MATQQLLNVNDQNLKDINNELVASWEPHMVTIATVKSRKQVASDTGRVKETVLKRSERGERAAASHKANKFRGGAGASGDATPRAKTFVNEPGGLLFLVPVDVSQGTP